MTWLKLLGSAFTAIPQWFLNKQENKAKEAERKDAMRDAVHERNMKLIEQGRINDAKWNEAQINNSAWRGNFLVIVLSIPMIMCFIPGLDVYVIAGFDALSKTPVWFQGAVSVMIAAAFGYKEFAKWRMDQLDIRHGQKLAEKEVSNETLQAKQNLK